MMAVGCITHRRLSVEAFSRLRTRLLPNWLALSSPTSLFMRRFVPFLVWVMWNKTRFGKNIFAIGGNPEAAKVSGVNVAL